MTNHKALQGLWSTHVFLSHLVPLWPFLSPLSNTDYHNLSLSCYILFSSLRLKTPLLLLFLHLPNKDKTLNRYYNLLMLVFYQVAEYQAEKNSNHNYRVGTATNYSPILLPYSYNSLSCLFKHYCKPLPLSSAPYSIPNLSTLSRQSCLLTMTWPFARLTGTSSLNDLILQNKTKQKELIYVHIHLYLLSSSLRWWVVPSSCLRLTLPNDLDPSPPTSSRTLLHKVYALGQVISSL